MTAPWDSSNETDEETAPWAADDEQWRGETYLRDWPWESYLGAEWDLFRRSEDTADD